MELRHLRYFVVCADVSSFSEAAEILYTTQPNVSKVIRSLEEELGFQLFIRAKKGIQLTEKGKYMYQYANNALANIEQMSSFSKKGMVKELLISSNPSSWMAACFAGFYNKYAKEDILFQLYSANVTEIIRRLSEYRDEIGFVYVMKNQKTAFQYALDKNRLEFKRLDESCAALYMGERHPQYHETDINKINWQEIELVQNYTEELAATNYWRLKKCEDEDFTELHVKVVTNSDCVVEQLLSTTKLANISSSYLTNILDERNYHGVPVYEKENRVWFGYIKRKEKELSLWAERYVEYVKQQIRKKL